MSAQLQSRPQKIRLGDLLVDQKLITAEQLKDGLDQQKKTGRRLGRVLIDAGLVTEEKIAEAMARQLNVAFVNLKHFNANPDAVKALPEAQARRFRALVLEDRKSTYLVGMADPTDLFAYDEIIRLLKRDIELAIVTETQVLEVIDRTYRRTQEITGLAKELQADIGEDAVDFGALGTTVGAEDAPVVKLLQSLFEDAAQVKASDIHIEPQEALLQIRFRIDGQLHLQTESDKRIAPAMVQRLKLMSGLNISEKRLPQDGRFNVRLRNGAIDVRISTMPTPHGESVVMRLLNQSSGLLSLDRIGMPPAMLERFRIILKRSAGMVLVTGPTGSGKTTTLYAALSELNDVEKKIITVEDPIEYRIPGLTQVQVNEKIELTFSRVLRSTLRQDPDIVLVGEMRDSETAEIGLRAAITGHLVLSTLHTMDSASTPVRLMDMGVPNFMVASSLQAVIAQRLVRKNCESCAAPYAPDAQEEEWLSHNARTEGLERRFMQGHGCARCNQSGFQGRTGVYELLEMTPDLVRAADNSDPGTFVRAAHGSIAGRTMRDHAVSLAFSGQTTLKEAMRVTSMIDD
jgi:MSHA biogenesis protein MshE